MKLQEYNFTVEYQQGKLNPADYMSRHPYGHPRATTCEQRLTEEHVHFVTVNAVPKSVTLDKIRTATRDDPVLVDNRRGCHSQLGHALETTPQPRDSHGPQESTQSE